MGLPLPFGVDLWQTNLEENIPVFCYCELSPFITLTLNLIRGVMTV